MPARILAQSKVAAKDAEQFAGLIIEPDVVAAADVDAWKKEGFHAIVLVLDERFDAVVYHRAAKVIASNGLDLYYWIEVGRNPTFAHDHPEWMASLVNLHRTRTSSPYGRQSASMRIWLLRNNRIIRGRLVIAAASTAMNTAGIDSPSSGVRCKKNAPVQLPFYPCIKSSSATVPNMVHLPTGLSTPSAISIKKKSSRFRINSFGS